MKQTQTTGTMKRYIRKNEVVEKLKDGYNIYTGYRSDFRRGWTYELCNSKDEFYGNVHHSTIEALQKNNIISYSYNLI